MREEIPYLHVVRVVACIMVVCLHSLPAFAPDSFWDKAFKMGVIFFTRPCVPLFLMITGVLLLPYKGTDMMSFYNKRISKIFFPLLFWGIVYSILPYLIGVETVKDMWHNLLFLPLTYPGEIGGILWYLYILIGIYLVIPFINPAIFEQRKQMLLYVGVWFVASLALLLKYYFPLTFGMTPFCSFDLFLYFSGYLGYLFLGKYLHASVKVMGGKKSLFKWMAIYLIAMASIYPIEKMIHQPMTAFLYFPAIIMSACMFIFLKNMSIQSDGILYKWIKEISALSFGIYLSHMVVYRTLTAHLYEVSTSPFVQVLVMLLTFIGGWVLTKMLGKLPWSKYVIGV